MKREEMPIWDRINEYKIISREETETQTIITQKGPCGTVVSHIPKYSCEEESKRRCGEVIKACFRLIYPEGELPKKMQIICE